MGSNVTPFLLYTERKLNIHAMRCTENVFLSSYVSSICVFCPKGTQRYTKIVAQSCFKIKGYSYNVWQCSGKLYLFVPNAPFSTPWKHQKTVFWYFQGVEEGCIGNEWVEMLAWNLTKNISTSRGLSWKITKTLRDAFF